jgi:nitrite reductase/ring-hydroxylating ferredoxin subunit
LLLVIEGRPVLLENRCPHQGAPLHNASLQGQVLRTPWRRA